MQKPHEPRAYHAYSLGLHAEGIAKQQPAASEAVVVTGYPQRRNDEEIIYAVAVSRPKQGAGPG